MFEFIGLELDDALSVGEGGRGVDDFNEGGLHAFDHALVRLQPDVRVLLQVLQLELEVDGARALYSHGVRVHLVHLQIGTEVDGGGEEFLFLGVDDGESVQRDHELVRFAVDANLVAVLPVLIAWRELHVYLLSDATWESASLAVLNLEVGSRGRDDEQALGSVGVVEEADALDVRLHQLVALELHH